MKLVRAVAGLLAAIVLMFPANDGNTFVRGGVTTNIPSSCSDSVPALAAGIGYNTCTFNDSMQSASTFDKQGTNNSGFNWYTQTPYCGVWFHATIAGTAMTVQSIDHTGGCDANVTAALGANQTIGQGGTAGSPTAGTTIVSGSGTSFVVTPSQTVSSSTAMYASFIQNGLVNSGAGLTINNNSQGANNFGLASTALLTNPAGANTWHGTVFANGLYARVYWAFDETKAPVCTNGLIDCRWPAWWATSYPGVVQNGPFVEMDAADALPGGGSVSRGTFVHAYNNGHGQVDSNFPTTTACTVTYDGSTFNTVDWLWIPSTVLNSTNHAGIWASAFNADTCGGNAIIKGHITGTTLTVESVISGSIGNNYMGGDGVSAGTKITSGSGTTWTVNNSQTVASGTTIIIANGNVCTYYLSPGQSGCSNTPYAGIFAEAESGSAGMTLILNSGCAGVLVSTPTTANQCSGTGEWDLLAKNVQVWQTSSINKVVQ